VVPELLNRQLSRYGLTFTDGHLKVLTGGWRDVMRRIAVDVNPKVGVAKSSYRNALLAVAKEMPEQVRSKLYRLESLVSALEERLRQRRKQRTEKEEEENETVLSTQMTP